MQKLSFVTGPVRMNHVISANRLADGAVVYLGLDDWVELLPASQVFPDKASAQSALETRGKRDAERNLVVDPAIVDLRLSGAGPEPAHIREAIRAKGPTVRADLGKQANG